MSRFEIARTLDELNGRMITIDQLMDAWTLDEVAALEEEQDLHDCEE